MENAVESIIIAFAVLVFVIALSMTTYMLSKAMTTTQDLIYYSDKTNYLQNIEDTSEDPISTREVSIDTVVNSLYRYYKENFMVRIYNKHDNLVQIFDTTIEGKIYVALSKNESSRTLEEQALVTNYGSGVKANLFGAPWMGNTVKDAKARVDLYVSGKKGYINSILVDYDTDDNGLYDLDATIFKETFIQYMYSGQTISTENGIADLTGNTKEKNKIIIDYRAIK